MILSNLLLLSILQRSSSSRAPSQVVDDFNPLPTPAQVAYQQGEIVAFVSFNMETYTENLGCIIDNWNDGDT